MSSQGPNFPTAASGNTNAVGGGSILWASPSNIEAADGVFSTCSMGANTSDDLIGTSFGFAIPSDATIIGILLEINRKSDTPNDTKEIKVFLLKAGSTAGSNKGPGTFLPTTAQTSSFGGSSDLWGTTWLPADINNSGFGAVTVYTAVNGSQASVDFFRITVFYTQPTLTGAITLSVTSGFSTAANESTSQNNISLGVTAGFTTATPVQAVTLPVTTGLTPGSQLIGAPNNAALPVIVGFGTGIVPPPPVLPVPPTPVQPPQVSLTRYTNLITSEHNQKPKFMAMIAAMTQPSVNLQNFLAGFPNAFDVDFAIGAQLDAVGLWVGATRELNEPITGVFFSWGISGLGWGQGTWFNPNFTQGIPIPGTRIQSSGGSSTLKYFLDLGLTVNGDQYSLSVLVKNQGPTAVSVGTIVAGVAATILPGNTQQVNFTYTGDGVGDQQMRFLTANVGDVMDIIAANPVMTHNNGSNLVTGASFTFGGSWAGFGGNTITLTQSFPGLFTSVLIILPDDSYRTLLRGVIAANQWDGTVPGAYNIFNTVFGLEGFQILIVDNQDMTMTIIVLAQVLDAVAKALLLSGLIVVRPAGVRITGYFGAVQPVFGFGEQSSLISGWGTGHWLQLVSF